MAACPVARLATITPEGRPHLVPVTFALTEGVLVTMIDHKPKTMSRLQRLVNIEHDPRASVLADHYAEDWESLWWVRVDGRASLGTEGARWEAARKALVGKYRQYRHRPPGGTAIFVSVDRVTWWASTP